MSKIKYNQFFHLNQYPFIKVGYLFIILLKYPNKLYEINHMRYVHLYFYQ